MKGFWKLSSDLFSATLTAASFMQVISYSALVINNPPANAGDPGSIPGMRRSPGEENGNWLQYSCLENPMDRGAWRATGHEVAQSLTWLSDWTTTSLTTTPLCQVVDLGYFCCSVPMGLRDHQSPGILLKCSPGSTESALGLRWGSSKKLSGLSRCRKHTGRSEAPDKSVSLGGSPQTPCSNAVLGPQSLGLRLERPWDPANHPQPRGLQTKTSQGHSFFSLSFLFVFFFLISMHGLPDLSSLTRDWICALGSESTEF